MLPTRTRHIIPYFHLSDKQSNLSGIFFLEQMLEIAKQNDIY